VSARDDEPRDSASPEGPAWDLAELVAELRTARRGQQSARRDEIERHQRPSREKLVEIVRDLRAALFPTHYGISDFTEASIDFFVGSTLDSALRALEEQVDRTRRHRTDEGDRAGAARTARSVVRAFARKLPGIRTLLEQDIRAAYDGDPAAKSRSEVIFCYPGITAIIHHRLAHELYVLGEPMLARLVAEIAHSQTGIDIHPGARIGERFFIDHGTGVVIGETAVIGDRVRIYQGVTIGARSFPKDEHGQLMKGEARHPVIEDDVVVYAGATILGRVTIGRGSTIGGNVWLTRSLPPNSHVTQALTQLA
jgi:serine O-acetyltransferase